MKEKTKILGLKKKPKKPRLEDNEAGRRRNKRLFGVLLGTLNKFKDDTEQTSEVVTFT